MPVEEQTQYNNVLIVSAPTKYMAGQRLTIPNRKLIKLAFVLYKFGSPPNDYSFEIRKVSDDSIITSEPMGLAFYLPTTPAWIEVELADQPVINEEVRICARYTHGDSTNCIRFNIQTSDVKAGEICAIYTHPDWDEPYAWDAAYRYTWESPFTRRAKLPPAFMEVLGY